MMALRVTMQRTLGDLLGAAAGGYARVTIGDLTLDSRQVKPGAAFVALAGAREHGLSYVPQALARGASVVLFDPESAPARVAGPCVPVPELRARLGELARAFFDTSATSTIVGVTGTNGKTTVAYLLAQALTEPQRACGYMGTLGYGIPPQIERHALTTPDVLTLHREIAELAAPRVAMEVSSHALAQDRIAGLSFHTAVFTNLTRDHLDEHGDFASYGRAKARLFQHASLAHAVLNADDAFSTTLAAVLPPGCEALRTSVRGAEAELRARIRRADLKGLELAVDGKFGQDRIASKLVGEFNAENLLGALGALLTLGLPLRAACAALESARAAPGRMDVIGGGPGEPWVVVDYAHTPDALERVLATLAPLATGDLWCVFGCGGDRDRGKRSLMGAAAASLADRIVVTDDNPRSEDPEAIVADIRVGLDAHPAVTVIHDRRAALSHALERARPGDVVLIAGKGHETEQLVGGKKLPFDDRAVALELLGGRP